MAGAFESESEMRIQSEASDKWKTNKKSRGLGLRYAARKDGYLLILRRRSEHKILVEETPQAAEVRISSIFGRFSPTLFPMESQSVGFTALDERLGHSTRLIDKLWDGLSKSTEFVRVIAP